jgi:hypothetical protein
MLNGESGTVTDCGIAIDLECRATKKGVADRDELVDGSLGISKLKGRNPLCER